MGITAHSKTWSPPILCNPTLMNITADVADDDDDDDDRNIYEASRGDRCGLEEAAVILGFKLLSIPVRIHTSEVESGGEAKSIHSNTSS